MIKREPNGDTPKKTGKHIDDIINHLNAVWNLGIPRLHGIEAHGAGDDSELKRKCSSRIRALCWKNIVNLQGVIEDFEERAKQLNSEWKCKSY